MWKNSLSLKHCLLAATICSVLCGIAPIHADPDAVIEGTAGEDSAETQPAPTENLEDTIFELAT